MRTPLLTPLLPPVALSLISLAGCGTPPAQPAGPVNTSLSALMSNKTQIAPTTLEVPDPAKPTEVERLSQEHRVDIQSVLDREAPPPAFTTDSPAPAPSTTAPAAHPVVETEVAADSTPAAPTSNPSTPEVPIEPPKSLDERIDDTSLLLIDLLRQRTAAGETPFSSALALAAMEAVRPGSALKVITPDSTDGGPLSDEQRQIVNAFRDLVTGLASSEDKPDLLTERASDLGHAFLRARPMRIAAALAGKVTGFGQYMPLDASRIQQGKPLRAVVYTEVKRFTQSPIKDATRLSESAQPGDKWAVELSQELQLIHDSDGVKAWQRPEQPIVETSRSYRTDFYLVQNITLPATLSIGKYKLKVIVRDKTSGHEDEAIIPLEVVADPALVSESGARLYD